MTANAIDSLFAGVVAKKDSAAKDALSLVPQDELAVWLAGFRAEAAAHRKRTLRGRLDGLRDHLGEKHFQAIAAGPSLGEVLSLHEQADKQAIGERAIDRLIKLAEAYPAAHPLGRPEAAAYFGAILMERGE